VQRGLLERRAPDHGEIRGHVKTAKDLLATARLKGAPARGRFFNLYEAAHAVALAGLKRAGYRSKEGEGSRQLVMSLAEQALALRRGASAVLSEANRIRNNVAYAGSDVDVPESTLESLEESVEEGIREVEGRLRALKGAL
jgi:hypothetical protein